MIKYVNTDGLNFRSGPGMNYNVIKTLNKGEGVEILKDGQWVKIKVIDKIGYVYNTYLEDKNPNEIIEYVNTNGLNFREGPGMSYKVIDILNKGNKVEVLKDGEWVQVRAINKIGYVYSKYLIKEDPIKETRYVNVDGLNFRQGPSMSYGVHYKLSKGDEVELLKSGMWSKIAHKDEIGYVYETYLSEKHPIKLLKYISINGLNFREGPGMNYKVLCTLSKSEQVEVLQEGEWTKIKAREKVGYVYKTYLIDYKIDETNKVNQVISMAKANLGKPYVWGANGPNSFDCSGFVKYIYESSIDINMPRVSRDQSKFGKYVSYDNLQKGDLVFFDTDLDSVVNHVGLYIGDNSFIHAASGKTMKVITSKMSNYYKTRFVVGRRLIE